MRVASRRTDPHLFPGFGSCRSALPLGNVLVQERKCKQRFCPRPSRQCFLSSCTCFGVTSVPVTRKLWGDGISSLPSSSGMAWIVSRLHGNRVVAIPECGWKFPHSWDPRFLGPLELTKTLHLRVIGVLISPDHGVYLLLKEGLFPTGYVAGMDSHLVPRGASEPPVS